MMATIHRVHSTNPIDRLLRVGHRADERLEDQLAQSALPYRRYVFEAADMIMDAENRRRSEAPLARVNANTLIVLERGA